MVELTQHPRSVRNLGGGRGREVWCLEKVRLRCCLSRRLPSWWEEILPGKVWNRCGSSFHDDGVQKDAGRDESRQGDSKRCARRRPCRRQSWPSRAKSVVIRVYTCVHMSYAHMNAAVEHFCYLLFKIIFFIFFYF